MAPMSGRESEKSSSTFYTGGNARSVLTTVLCLLGVVAIGAFIIYLKFWSDPGQAPTFDPKADRHARQAERSPRQVLSDLRSAVVRESFDEANELEKALVALGPAVVPELKVALEKVGAQDVSDVNIRQRAAWVLGQIGGSASAAALAENIKSGDLPLVRSQALLAISKIEGDAAIKMLEATLLNEKEVDDLRRSAALLLAKRSEAEATQRLVHILSTQTSAELRIWMVAALGFSTNQGLASTTLRALLKDETADTLVGHAAQSLARVAGPEALGDLRHVLKQREDPATRRQIIAAVGILNAQAGAQEILLQSLKSDADQGVRALSAKHLSMPGLEALIPSLENLLAAEKAIYVRLKITEAIAGIGGAKAHAALKKIVAQDRMVAVRNMADQLLKGEQIGAGSPAQQKGPLNELKPVKAPDAESDF